MIRVCAENLWPLEEKPNSRGVVSTANYEARKYGIRFGYALCLWPIDFVHDAYFYDQILKSTKRFPKQIREIFFTVTDLVEPLSLDEAYLDVTENNFGQKSATLIAQWIKGKILERTELTASAGVGPNKFIAKICSEYNKPNGLCVVRPQEVIEFIKDLPVIRVPGIGKVTNRRLESMGISRVVDPGRKIFGISSG